MHLPTPDGVSVYRKQYRLAYHDRPIVAEAIEKWKADGIITEVPPDLRTMKWNNPITLAPKKDELGRKTGHRPCLDPRALNQLLPEDWFPLPLMGDIFDKIGMAKANFYSSLDIVSAFHKLPIAEEDQVKTSFTGPDGKVWMFRGAPFGIRHLSSKFQRVMTSLLGDLPFCSIFVDDIVLYATTMEEHTQQVAEVIKRLTAVNLELQPKKCFLGMRSIYLLGFL